MNFLLLFFGFSNLVNCAEACICYGTDYSCINDAPCKSVLKNYHSIPEWEADPNRPSNLGLSYIYTKYDELVNLSSMKSITEGPINIQLGYTNTVGTSNLNGVNFTGVKKIVFASDQITMINDVDQEIIFKSYENLDVGFNITVSNEFTIESSVFSTVGFGKIIIFGQSCLLNCENYNSQVSNLNFAGTFKVTGTSKDKITSLRSLYKKTPLLSMFAASIKVCIGGSSCENGFLFETTADFEAFIPNMELTSQIEVYLDPSITEVPFINEAKLGIHSSNSFNFNHDIQTVFVYDDHISLKVDKDQRTMISFYDSPSVTAQIASKYIKISNQYEINVPSISLTIKPTNALSIDIENIKSTKYMTLSPDASIDVYSQTDLTQIFTSMTNVNNIVISSNSFCVCSGDCSSVCPENSHTSEQFIELPYETLTIGKDVEIDFNELHVSYQDINVVGNLVVKNANEIRTVAQSQNAHLISTKGNIDWSIKSSDTNLVTINVVSQTPFELIDLSTYSKSHSFSFKFDITEDNCYIGYYTKDQSDISYGSLITSGTYTVNIKPNFRWLFSNISSSLAIKENSYATIIGHIQHTFETDIKPFYGNGNSVPYVYKEEFKEIASTVVYCYGYQDLVCDRETSFELHVYGLLTCYEVSNFNSYYYQASFGTITLVETVGSSLVRLFMTSKFFTDLRSDVQPEYKLLVEVIVSQKSCFLGRSENIILYGNSDINSFTLRTTESATYIYFIDNEHKPTLGAHISISKTLDKILPSICIASEHSNYCGPKELTLLYKSFNDITAEPEQIEKYNRIIYNTNDGIFDATKLSYTYKVISSKAITVKKADQVNFGSKSTSFSVNSVTKFIIESATEIKIQGGSQKTILTFSTSNPFTKTTLVLAEKVNYFYSSSSYSNVLHVSSTIKNPIIASDSSYLSEIQSLVISEEVAGLTFRNIEEVEKKVCVCTSNNYETDCQPMCGDAEFADIVTNITVEPSLSKIYFVGEGHEVDISTFTSNHIFYGNITIIAEKIEFRLNGAYIYGDANSYSPEISVAQRADLIATFKPKNNKLFIGPSRSGMPYAYYTAMRVELTTFSDTELAMIPYSYSNCKSNNYCYSQVLSIFTKLDKAFFKVTTSEQNVKKYLKSLPSNVGSYSTDLPDIVTCICPGDYRFCRKFCGDVDEGFVYQYDSVEDTPTSINTELIYIKDNFAYTEKWDGEHTIICNGNITVSQSVSNITSPNNDKYLKASELKYKLYSKEGKIIFNSQSSEFNLAMNDLNSQIDVIFNPTSDFIKFTSNLQFSSYNKKRITFSSLSSDNPAVLVYDENTPSNEVSNMLAVITLNEVEIISSEFSHKVVCFCKDTNCQNYCNNPATSRMVVFSNAEDFVDKSDYDDYEFWFYSITGTFSQTQFTFERTMNTISHYESSVLSVNNVDQIEKGDKYVKIGKLTINLDQEAPHYVIEAELKSECTINTMVLGDGIIESDGKVQLRTTYSHISGTINERINAFTCNSGTFAFDSITDAITYTFRTTVNSQIVIYKKDGPYICICQDSACDGCNYGGNPSKYSSFSDITEEPDSNLSIQLLKDDTYPSEWTKDHHIVGNLYQTTLEMNSYSKEITLRSKSSVIVGNVETTNIKIKLINDHHIDISIEGGVESATENIVEFKVIDGVFFNFKSVASTSLSNLFAINSDEIVWPKLMISDEKWTELFTHTGIVEGISFEQNEMPKSSLYCISKNIQGCGNFAPVFYKHYTSAQDLIKSVGEPGTDEKIIINDGFDDFNLFEKKHIFIVEDTKFKYYYPKKIVVVDNGIELNDVGTLYSKLHYIYYSSYDSQIPIFNVGANVETVPNINFRILGPLGITLKVESYLTPLPQTFYLNVDTIFLAPPSCTEEIKDMFINVQHIYCEDEYEEITCVPEISISTDAFADTICLTNPHSKVHFLPDNSDIEPNDTKVYIAENYKLNIVNWENEHEIYLKGMVYPAINISLKEEGKTSIWNSKNTELALFDKVQIGLNVYGTAVDIKNADIACPHTLIVQNNLVSLGEITSDKTYSNPLFTVNTSLDSAKLRLSTELRTLFTVDSKITFTESDDYNTLCICATDDPQICSQACGPIDDNVLISDRMIYNKIFEKYYIHADSFKANRMQVILDSSQMKESISINAYNPNSRYMDDLMAISVIGANKLDLTNEEIVSGNFNFSKNTYLNLQSATSEYTIDFPSNYSLFGFQFIVEFTYKNPTLYANVPPGIISFGQIIYVKSIFDPAIPVKLIMSNEEYDYDLMIIESSSAYIIDLLSLKYTCLYNTNQNACDKSDIYVNEDITLTYKDSIPLANFVQDSIKYLYIAEDLPAETEILASAYKMVLGNPTKKFSFAINIGDYTSTSIYGSFYQLNYQCSYSSTFDLYQSIKKQNATLNFTKIQFDFESYYYNNQETISIGPNLFDVLQNSGATSITTKNNGLHFDTENNIKRQIYMDFADKTKFLVREYKIDSFCFAPEMNLFCGSTKDKVISSDFHKFAEQMPNVEKDVVIYLAYQNGLSTEPIDINVKEIASNSLTLQFNQEFTANFSACNGQISTIQPSSKATFIDVIDLVKETVGTFLNIEKASIKIIPSNSMEFTSIQLPQNTQYTFEQTVFETEKGQYTFSVDEKCELIMTTVSYVQNVDVGTNDPITVQSQTKWLVIDIKADSLTLDLSKIIQGSSNLKTIEVKGGQHSISLVFPVSPVSQTLMISNTTLSIKQVTTNTFAKLYLTKCFKSDDKDQNIVGENIYCDVFSIGVTEKPHEIQIPDTPNGKIEINEDGIKYSEDQNEAIINTEAVTVGKTISVGSVHKDIKMAPASSNEKKETTITIQENGNSNAISAKDFDTLIIKAENGVSQIPINPVRTKEIQIESNEKVFIEKVIPNEESTTINVNNELEINTVELEKNSVLKFNSDEAIIQTVISKEKSAGNIHKASINTLNIEQNSKISINECQVKKEINYSSESFDGLGTIIMDSSSLVSINVINIKWNDKKKVQNMNLLEEQKTEKTIIEGLTDEQCNRFYSESITINFDPASSDTNELQMECENHKLTVIKTSKDSPSLYQTISEEPVTDDDEPSDSPNSNKKNKLSGGEIAGIVVGCVAVVAIIVAVVIIVIKKKKNNNSSSENSIDDPNEV